MKRLSSITLLIGYTLSGFYLSFASPALAITPKDKCEYVRRNINTLLPRGVNLNSSYVYDQTTCVLGGPQQAVVKTVQAIKNFPPSGVRLPLEDGDCLYYRFQAVTQMGIYIDLDSCGSRE
jgi:hypothetical protein